MLDLSLTFFLSLSLLSSLPSSCRPFWRKKEKASVINFRVMGHSWAAPQPSETQFDALSYYEEILTTATGYLPILEGTATLDDTAMGFAQYIGLTEPEADQLLEDDYIIQQLLNTEMELERYEREIKGLK